MPDPHNYTQLLVCRAAGYCAGKGAKTLIITLGIAVQEIKASVSYLKLEGSVEVLDATDREASPENVLDVDLRVGAVLITAVSFPTMKAAGKLCANYNAAGIPVVVITGWPPPTDRSQFLLGTTHTGNLSVPGMFDLAAAYCGGGVQGDILEFGTFQGYTLQCAYHAFDRRKMAGRRRFVAFDSFAGIIGTKNGEQFIDGQFSASEESLRFSNLLAGVPEDKVFVVSGAYETTLGKDKDKTREVLGPTKAAIVHIDCDVEAPAKRALDFVTPYMEQGTLLLFDEYDLNRASNVKGERAALRAWLSENSEFEAEPYRTYHTHARAFIVHRK